MRARTIVCLLSFAGWLIAATPSGGQGTVYLSNLGEASITSGDVASDAWAAALFRTGGNPNGYHLSAIELLMTVPFGAPSGFSVSLYDFDGSRGSPGVWLAGLNGPDPISASTYSYSASDVTLESSTSYFVVLTAMTPTVLGSYRWNIAETRGYDSDDGWLVGSGVWVSSDGTGWGFGRPLPFQLAIYATPIPEPSSLALLGLGGLFVFSSVLRRRLKGCR